MSVSVVVPYYRDRDTIAGCIESLVSQDVAPLEIVVVNDGSDEPFPEYVATHALVIQQAHEGAASARNRGAGIAHGDLVAFCEADGRYSSNFLRLAQATLNESGVVGVNVARRRHWHLEGERCSRLVETYQDRKWEAIADLTRLGRRAALGAWVFRRETFETLGGYSTSLSVGEDRDFVRRLVQMTGGRVAAAPETVLWHREPNTIRLLISSAFHRSLHSLEFRARADQRWRRGGLATTLVLAGTLALIGVVPWAAGALLVLAVFLGWLALPDRMRMVAAVARAHGLGSLTTFVPLLWIETLSAGAGLTVAVIGSTRSKQGKPNLE